MEPRAGNPTTRSSAALAVLTLVWLIGTPYLLVRGLGEGGVATGGPSNHDVFARYLTATAFVMVGAPAIAAFIAGATRRKAAMLFFAIATVGCALLVFAVVASGNRADPAQPRSPLPSNYCVEHSGGDNDCPGG
ncbi:hypothetical protein AB0O34_36515 [Sphaerisporangium sp. NPDC088356]|uniref:hypothetical protein n=1 Tax=Sphaerisporangium sp. NPDC088356 TaxID=3154871 RepID=UPI003443E139